MLNNQNYEGKSNWNADGVKLAAKTLQILNDETFSFLPSSAHRISIKLKARVFSPKERS